MTICLLCGHKRIETCCGDQSCGCRDGSPMRVLEPVGVVAGIVYRDRNGAEWITEKCGRMSPVRPAPIGGEE